MYTFLWLTAAACPLNSNQHDNCMVTNPATGQTQHQVPDVSRLLAVGRVTLTELVSSPVGYLFDLNSLTKEGGYTVFDHQEPRKMFRMNVCGNLTNSGCAPDVGTYIHPVSAFIL